MANGIEKLKKRAFELSEEKNEVKEQKRVNLNDLSITNELFNIPLENDSTKIDINSLSKAVDTEQNQIKKRIGDNQEKINKTSNEADDSIKGLKSNVRKLEQMEKVSNLVNVEQQIGDTKTRIEELVEVKKMLGETLEIQPLNEGVDLGFNYDEVMAKTGTTEQPYESSTLETVVAATMSNIDSPGMMARIIGGLAGGDPVSSKYAAQLAQMGIDATLPTAEGFMEAVHRQHALDCQRPSFPKEGVDFIRNENGKPEPIRPMIPTTDDNGESVWVRPSNDTKGE